MTDAPDAIRVITHVDLAPNALARRPAPAPADAPPPSPADQRARMGEVIAANLGYLAELAAAAKADSACLSFEVLQEVWRRNHLSLVSIWRDLDAFEAFEASEPARKVREAIQPNLGAPWDTRIHRLLP